MQIQRVRKTKGFTQEGFAAKAGMSRSYYGEIERGERNVGCLILVKIATELEVEVGELFPTTKALAILMPNEWDIASAS